MSEKPTLEAALKHLCEDHDLAEIFETLATILDEQRETVDRDRITRLLEDASRILRQLDC